MMKGLIFCMDGNTRLQKCLLTSLDLEDGRIEQRQFPDGETYVRILSEVNNKICIIVCTLDRPDSKVLPLLFLIDTLKTSGSKKVILVAPYLSYMRQDKVFNQGEALTSAIFAKLLSGYPDEIITIDPHLHRHKNMSTLYTVPVRVLHSTSLIAEYIKEKVTNPLIIGPDSESKQWASQVSHLTKAPYVILEKTRKGDRNVKVQGSGLSEFANYTPVLIDDIISTARTLTETVKHLVGAGFKSPVCIGVHAVFSGDAYEHIATAGVAKVVTTNTIVHSTNEIDISGIISESLRSILNNKP